MTLGLSVNDLLPRARYVRTALVVIAGLIVASCAPEHADVAAADTVAPAPAATLAGETEDCADVTPNAAYTQCFGQLALAAQGDVAAEMTKARKLAQAADAEYSRYAPGSLTADAKTQLARHLAMSHENWLRYAEGQCELEATAARGGSGTDTLRQKCLLRLARLRLAELRGAQALIDGNR